MEQRLSHPLVVLAFQGLAFWPTWRWYGARITDGSDEPWCVLALATALLLLWVNGKKPAVRFESLRAPFAFVAVYPVVWVVAPPIFAAAVAMLAVASTLSFFRSGRLFNAGIWGLMLLALPLLASLQFYVGYPLRAAAGHLAAPLISLSGFPTVAEGAVLNWDGRLVEIDAPCSGVRMLWVSGFLTFVLAAVYRLRAVQTLAAMAGAVAALLAGNVLRAVALFYIETDAIAAPAWAHTWVGVVAFALMATLILRQAEFLREAGQ